MIKSDRIRAYQSLRQAGKEFFGKLLGVIPKDVLVSTAQELGLWKSGILFYRLHRRFDIEVQYGAGDEE